MATSPKIVPFLWFDNQALEAARFYTSIFKNSRVLNDAVSEAFSFQVGCETQEEVDSLTEKLTSGGGNIVQCGWIKDKFGLSWQIVPTILEVLASDKDKVKANRVMAAMMKMKVLNIEELKKAHRGE